MDRRRSIFGVIAVGAILAVATLASLETVRASRTTDFECLRTAATFLLDGRDPYDEGAWQAAIAAASPDRYGVLRTPPCPGGFGYPLWTALPFVPLAALPSTVAAGLWQLLLLVGVVAGAALAWCAVGGARRSWPTFAVVVLTSFPVWQLLLVAQFGGVMLLLVGAIAFAYRARREALAGVVVSALALKPHVAFLVPVVALVGSWRRGERRTIIVAGLAFVVLLIGSIAVRPAWPAQWIEELLGHRAEMAGVSPTVWSFAARSLGDARYGLAIVGGCFLLLVALLHGLRIDVISALAIATASSLVLSPYIGLHDEVTLALPWAKSLAVALALTGPRRALLAMGVVVCAGLLPWSLDAYEHLISGDESASGVVPVASLLLLAVALRLEGGGPAVAA
jgi:hypothetical protein